MSLFYASTHNHVNSPKFVLNPFTNGNECSTNGNQRAAVGHISTADGNPFAHALIGGRLLDGHAFGEVTGLVHITATI